DVIFHEDSDHKLVVHCEDALENPADDVEYFKVDSTPPVTTKTIGKPLVKDGLVEWINFSTPINLSAQDAKVGVDKTWYKDRVLYGEDQLACANPAEHCQPRLLDDCMYCKNGEYPRECIDIQQEYCTKNWEEMEYNSWAECVEEESWNHCCGGWNWNLFKGVPIYKTEESCHVLYYFSVDKLGNVEPINVNCFYVENTPPKTTKDISEPKVVIGDKTYISQQSLITLRCAEQGPHPTGKTSINYRYRYAMECEGLPGAEWSKWMVYEGPISFKEDSCHELEYYCEDGLGNKEQTKSEIDIVDTKPPEIKKTIIGPYSGACPPEYESDVCYIDGVTKIHVEATDPQPHPVDSVKCEWYYILDDGQKIFGGDDQAPPFDITFPEDTKHELHIKCWDALKNKVEDVETFYVDKTPPETRKEYGQPFYSNKSADWITNQTNISLFAYDAGPHKSGVKEINWRVSLVDDKYCYDAKLCQEGDDSITKQYDKASPKLMGEYIYGPVIFTIPQDSCHLIEYYSVDNVNKTEAVNRQCVFVDNKPPLPNKTVGDPKTMWNGSDSIFYPWIKDKCWNGQSDEIECWKVTMGTPINLECIDQQPHPVDHNRVCFKVELDGEDATDTYCNELDAQFVKSENNEEDGFCCLPSEKQNFVFKEETEHNLKYYCEDALGNRGPIDEEKFKVEGTKFKIPLRKKWNLISVPFVLINDNPTEVFKDTPGVLSVWTWDSENGWRYYTPEEEDSDTLTEIEPGWGYWVLENNTEECLMLGGSLFSPKTLPPSKELTKGWNLIGFYGTNWQYYGKDNGGCGGEIFGEKVY
ncbi:MAG: hypothetical protein MUP55_04695, partial [Candidatus Aenigmarchaeota archaeon]|nr:hypothetical protein [Candidatus Aenigmarchaeota archaeon]